ncbi:ATP-binding protein [Reichenbachiella ulvae]|uniref:histidine kinase n=1 Tax=Reichenbachiella ulvae TaxID=2980104 RepID=A0ABT3CZH2_9BACT|nr:ATP-binding protein [Reichenbachiella ulvae]MCV9389090.1 ATP-binding protein [Reichenbachiella ulvae]
MKIRLAVLFIFCVHQLFANPTRFPIQKEDSTYVELLEAIVQNRNPHTVLKILSDTIDYSLCSNDSLRSRIYYHLGRAHGQLGNFDPSIQYLDQALQLSLDHQLSDGIIGVLMAQGNVYWAKDYYQLALKSYHRALDQLEVLEVNNQGMFRVMLLSNIAGIHSVLEDYDQALEFSTQSTQIAYRTGNLRPRGHLKFGTILNQLGQFQRALDSLQVTEKLILEAGDSVALVHCHLANAMAHKGLQDIESAKAYMDRAFSVGALIGYQMSDLMIQMGELWEEQNQLGLAIQYYDSALQVSIAQNSIKGQAEAYQKLTEANRRRKQYQTAFEYLSLATALRDSIGDVDVRNRINELNTEFETEKKVQQIARLEQEGKINELESERQQQLIVFFLIAAVLLIVALAMLYFRYRDKKKNNSILDTKNQELAQLNHTKDRLFSIISHDLRSPLSSFHTITRGLSDNWDNLEKEQLKDFIISLRDSSQDVKNMMDNLLKWALSQTQQLKYKPTEVETRDVVDGVVSELRSVALLKEIEIKREYHTEQKIRADRDFLQIVVRNILSNALKFSDHKSVVAIKVEDQTNVQMLTIQDFGVGMDQEEVDQLLTGEIVAHDIQNSSEKGTGLGLVLCKELMDKMNARIEVKTRKGQGTLFQLYFEG